MSSRLSGGRIRSANARFDFARRVISEASGTAFQRMNPQWPVVTGQRENSAGPTRLNSLTGPQ
jgi:hypothetical protein